MLDWEPDEKPTGNGQRGVQTRPDHQRIASRQATAQPGEHSMLSQPAATRVSGSGNKPSV